MRKILLGIIAVLFIAACSGGANCSQGEACQYYQGTEGVEMQQEDLPREFYYDSGVPKENNAVEFSVSVENRGASDTYGAVFLTGFSPDTFSLYKINDDGSKEPFSIARTGNGCQLTTSGFSFLNPGETPTFNFGVSGDCGNFFVRGDSSGTITAGGNPTALLEEELGVNLPDTDLTVQSDGDGLEIGFGVTGTLIDIWGHGRALVAIASELSLSAFNGAEYILPGENPDTPSGGEAFKTFRAEMKSWPAGTDSYDFRYELRNCYAYTTFASPSVCIDPNPQAPQADKICRGDRSIPVSSQGGPVAVTSLRQENTGSGVILNFQISNVGNGRVLDLGQLQACSPYYPGRTQPSMYDTVYVGQAYLGDDPLRCGGEAIRLDESGNGRLDCRYEFQGEPDIDSAYTEPLKLELWYGYQDRIRRTINARRIG